MHPKTWDKLSVNIDYDNCTYKLFNSNAVVKKHEIKDLDFLTLLKNKGYKYNL